MPRRVNHIQMLNHMKNNKTTIIKSEFDNKHINCNNRLPNIFKEITITMSKRFLKENIYKGNLNNGHGNKYTK